MTQSKDHPSNGWSDIEVNEKGDDKKLNQYDRQYDEDEEDK